MVDVINELHSKVRYVAAALGLVLVSSPLWAQEQEFFHTSHRKDRIFPSVIRGGPP